MDNVVGMMLRVPQYTDALYVSFNILMELCDPTPLMQALSMIHDCKNPPEDVSLNLQFHTGPQANINTIQIQFFTHDASHVMCSWVIFAGT